MKAEELMIGDLLKWKEQPGFNDEDRNMVLRVKNILDDAIKIDGRFELYHISLFESIPLTPEILEKNGFTKSTLPPGIHARCYELDNKKDRYNLIIADYNKYKRLLLDVDSEDSECFNIKCDYVHELQHALHLCKIEKEIIL